MDPSNTVQIELRMMTFLHKQIDVTGRERKNVLVTASIVLMILSQTNIYSILMFQK